MDAPVTTLLTGWGRTAPSAAQVLRPRTATEVSEALSCPPPRGVVARGLGRAYGDAAQNAGGVVLEMTGLTGHLELDAAAGTVTVDAGTSLDALLRALVPAGWFVGVTPGTRFVTVGGAIASDVHGKNHHVDGGFGRWVERLTLATPAGVHDLEPGCDLFRATTGGMGLTGVVTRATLRLLPIETSTMRVRTDRTADLDGALDLLSGTDRYSVAWVDLLARGAATGRAVVLRGDHARAHEVADRDPLAWPGGGVRVPAPPWAPSGLLNRVTATAFNEAWYHAAPRSREALQPVPAFFHPLDGVPGWNRLYGSRGFLQYQLVVPTGAEDVLRRVVHALSAASVPSFLTVLKRLGPGDGWLSFPVPGWTLALDVPCGVPGLAGLLDDLDAEVAAAGGRVYLSKDSRLRPDVLAAMYPDLERWQAVQAAVDPHGVLRSDLSRRLPLLAPGRTTGGR